MQGKERLTQFTVNDCFKEIGMTAVARFGCTVAFVLLTFTGTVGITQEPQSLRDMPFALVCAHSKGVIMLYLSELETDGSATYAALTGNRTGIVSPEGVFERIGRSGTTSDRGCSGKSIEELRNAGLTIEYPNY